MSAANWELERARRLLKHAQLEAEQSTCHRLHVGAVIARDGRIIVSGYNGAARGLAHCGDECYPGGPPCRRAVHAEANAIAFAAKYGIGTFHTMMVSTDSPCLECARLIINSGIAEVFYTREYRDTQPLIELQKAGVRTLMI
jgi:dCMP deaminase